MEYSDFIYQPALILVILYLVIQLIHVISLITLGDDDPPTQLSDHELPFVTVMVAARNEALNILPCLEALHRMNYPSDKIEFLIGDDHSEDNTLSLAQHFASLHPLFHIHCITTQLGKAKGKANVLAQLAHQAKGSYLLITDADVEVNREWAREIIAHFDEETGIVSGTTVVNDSGNMGKMQGIDWIYYMGLLKSFYHLGFNCTAVGNNMAIRTHAYQEVGGYENLDFSITEDYKLYKEVRKKNWKTKNILNKRIINKSRAIMDIRTLLYQRKRWLTGARELDLHWWIFFGIFGMFSPAIIVVALFHTKLALILYFLKMLLQSVSINILQGKISADKTIDYLFSYELYSMTIAITTAFFFILPFEVKWKNRSYPSHN